MKLGVMQPYFFPYLGYFDLIHSVDRWIVFDTAQYIRHGWVNRNRVLHPTQGWQYVIVPLQKHAQKTPIRDIRIAEAGNWKKRIQNQLGHYRGRAPHFDTTLQLVHDCLTVPGGSLSRLNVEILAKVCAFLGIPFAFKVLSDLDLALGPVEEPGDWALRIAESLGAREYVNPPGGKALFDPANFSARGIRLTLQRPIEFAYECPGYSFEPALSIIDVLMWNSPGQVRDFLEERRRQERRAD